MDEMRRLVESLLERNPLESSVTLVLADPAPLFGMTDLAGRELDDLLHEARSECLIAGDVSGGDGSVSYWFGLRVRVDGLRLIGEWPPRSHERVPGPWHDGIFGREAIPRLTMLAANPPVVLFRGDPLDPASHRAWDVVTWLTEAGLIDADKTADGLQDIRVTRLGQRALSGPEDDPLSRARAHLAQGAKADAVTAAVEEALKRRLHELAAAHAIKTTKESGAPVALAALNNALAAADAYGEPRRAAVQSWLAVRNAIAHGRAREVEIEQIRRLVEDIADFS